MTVVSYKNSVIAADTMSTHDEAKIAGVTKIARGADGSLYGFAGNAAVCTRLLDEVNSEGEILNADIGRCSEGYSEACYFKVSPSEPDVIEYYSADGVERFKGLPYFTIGAGRVGALCAMHAGASAVHSVRAVREHTNYAGGCIEFMTFKSEEKQVFTE